MNIKKKTIFAVLVVGIANLFPLYGVLFLNWKVDHIVALFWIETVVIGCVTVPALWMVARKGPFAQRMPKQQYVKWLAVGTTGLFFFHFGAWVLGEAAALTWFVAPHFWQVLPLIKIQALAIALSHVLLFLVNYVGKKEYLHRGIIFVSLEPYKRLWMLTIVVILGGFAVQLTKNPLWALVVLVLLKMVVDIWGQMRRTVVHSASEWVRVSTQDQYPEGLREASRKHIKSQIDPKYGNVVDLFLSPSDKK